LIPIYSNHKNDLKLDGIILNFVFLCYNFNDFKCEKVISMSENKTNINWLACKMIKITKKVSKIG